MEKLAEVKLKSQLTCPMCGNITKEVMPENYCLIMYQCKNCDKIIKPMAGDCCVFCSHGSVKCPSRQYS